MFKDLIHEIWGLAFELLRKEETIAILFIVGFAGIFALLYYFNLWYAFWLFLRYTWWLWLFILVFKLYENTWLFWRRMIFQTMLTPWKVMEIRVPRETVRSPKAMEQVLMAIHALRNLPNDPGEYYWDGEITRWYALEMVSKGGEVHFYIRFFSKQKTLVQAAFFAHYPEVELVEVPDYVDEVMPASIRDLYERGYDIWGSELKLAREEIYPIKMYKNFVDDPDEERRIDPISTFLEVLGKIESDEVICIQILLTPGLDDWNKKWEPMLKEIKEKTSQRTIITETGDEKQGISMRTPGETDLLRDVEENLSKPVFKTLIRFLYIAKMEGFYDSYPRRGIKGAFNQYSSLGRNSFDLCGPTMTKTKIWHPPYIAPKTRGEFRKQRLFFNYKNRELPQDTWVGKIITSYFFNWNTASREFMLNTEAIATIFHPPIETVLTGPHMHRIESRKASVPSGLPVVGRDEDIEKFL